MVVAYSEVEFSCFCACQASPGRDDHRAVVVEYPAAVAEVAGLRPCAAAVGVGDVELVPARVHQVPRHVGIGYRQVDGGLSVALDAGEGVLGCRGRRACTVLDGFQALAVLEDVVAHSGQVLAQLDDFQVCAALEDVVAKRLNDGGVDCHQFGTVLEGLVVYLPAVQRNAHVAQIRQLGEGVLAYRLTISEMDVLDVLAVRIPGLFPVVAVVGYRRAVDAQRAGRGERPCAVSDSAVHGEGELLIDFHLAEHGMVLVVLSV